jgi:hypothetical protein
MSRVYQPGDRVLIHAHPDTHDHGIWPATIVDPHFQDQDGYVSVTRDGLLFESVPVSALEFVAAKPKRGPLYQAALFIALASLIVAITAFCSQPARADSPLDFFQTQVVAHPAPQTGRFVSTRRPVVTALPLPRPPYIRGRLTCATNVNRHLAARGIDGTGSSRALDFLGWGRASALRPGAVQVERRRGIGKGHVKIVSHHDGDRWICLNPSVSRQAWVLAPCGPRGIAWRVAA